MQNIIRIMQIPENLLGQNIRKFRKARNLTQMELSSALGIDFKYLSRLETGIASPSIKTLIKLSQVLNVSMSQLFDFSESKSPENLKQDLFNKINAFSFEKLLMVNDLLNVIDRNYAVK